MVQHKNTDGMVAYVRKRHNELSSKVEEILSDLELNHGVCDFKNVAELSGVSIAWLYRQPQIKSRIQELIKINIPSPRTKEKLVKSLLPLKGEASRFADRMPIVT